MLRVISGDVARVNGQLAVSRAFGDKNLKSHLRSDPDIQTMDVDANTDLLILASDGLWKVTFLSRSLSPPPVDCCYHICKSFPYRVHLNTGNV